MLDVTLNNVPLQMELDTGASVSVLNKDTYKSIRQQSYLAPVANPVNELRSYTGHGIPVLSTMKVKVRYGDKEQVLPVHVVKGGGPNLMGRDWLSHLGVNLKDVHCVEPSSPLGKVLDKFGDVFKEELGCVKDVKVKLVVHDRPSLSFSSPELLLSYSGKR